MLNAFISLLFKFQFNAKQLTEFNNFIFKNIFFDENKYKNKIIGIGQNILKPIFEQYQLVDAVKGTDFNEIIIFIGFPKYENGYINRIYLPGLSQQFKKIVFGN